jgi:hypothetical protein
VPLETTVDDFGLRHPVEKLPYARMSAGLKFSHGPQRHDVAPVDH